MSIGTVNSGSSYPWSYIGQVRSSAVQSPAANDAATSGTSASGTVSTATTTSPGTTQDKSIDELLSELSSLLGGSSGTQMTAYQYNSLFNNDSGTSGSLYKQNV